MAEQRVARRSPTTAAVRTEADVIASLDGALTLDEVYRACEAAGVTSRDDGDEVIHSATDTRWKRRVRSHLQRMKQTGRARRVGDATWVIEGTRERPERALLFIAGDPSEITLILGAAAEVLAGTREPYDLIVGDPPWALEVPSDADPEDRIEHAYVRDSTRVVPGYVEVPASRYAEFTEEWVAAAVAALRPGGHLAIITGPQAAARVQITAEDAGLTYLNTIVVPRPFAMRCTRKYAFAHTTITVLTAGPERSARRFFAVPAGIPKAASGVDYPLDVWHDVPKFERQGMLRYPCGGLHPTIVRRIVHSYTRGPENGHAPLTDVLCDPFLGGGTSAVVAWQEGRRFVGVDRNPEALRFTMARLMTEHVQPRLSTPQLAI